MSSKYNRRQPATASRSQSPKNRSAGALALIAKLPGGRREGKENGGKENADRKNASGGEPKGQEAQCLAPLRSRWRFMFFSAIFFSFRPERFVLDDNAGIHAGRNPQVLAGHAVAPIVRFRSWLWIRRAGDSSGYFRRIPSVSRLPEPPCRKRL